MSRSGYNEPDFSSREERWAWMRYRGSVASAIRGRRGQAFLRELRDALDAMPQKTLISDRLQSDEGVCAIGAVAARRGLDVEGVDAYDSDSVAALFGIAAPMARELVDTNDEAWAHTGADRWRAVRRWVGRNIQEDEDDGAS